MIKHYDALVLGGGPAGSTTAAVLAQHGRKVAVVEKEKFPRYHIGESLIPYTYYAMERSGVLAKVKARNFVKKYSVQFVSKSGRASIPFYFFNQLKHEASMTWQVRRDEFDLLLLNHARELGAEVFEETQAKEVIKENGFIVGARTVSKTGENIEFRAPITIDCTGRDAISVARNGWRVFDPQLNKIAIWTYFKGAIRDPGIDEGATTVAYVPEKGWFWYIPLHDETISVGIVAEKDYLFKPGQTRDLKEIFDREVQQNKWMEAHLAPGTSTGVYRTTGEYSYRSKYCAADGLILAGDAFAFLDPVFSSGVCLALVSGVMAADAAHLALQDKDFRAERFENYGKELCYGIESMRRLVYAFYDHGFRFKEVFDKYPETRGELTECLMGDLFKDFDPLFAKVAEFAKVPPPVKHGLPAPRAEAAD